MCLCFSPLPEKGVSPSSPGTESGVTEGPWEESDVSWIPSCLNSCQSEAERDRSSASGKALELDQSW